METVGFLPFDYIVFASVFLGSLGIGVFYAWKGSKSNAEFLMANRSMGVLPVSFSLMASYLSSIMLLGIPAEVYGHGVEILVLFMGMFSGMLVATRVFIPILFRLQLTSVYEYLEIRFKSKPIRWVSSLTFIVQMVLYMSIVLYAPTLSLQPVTDLPQWVVIIITGTLCTAYTTFGGLKAVVWTDVFQVIIMFLGVITIVFFGFSLIGGFNKTLELALPAGRINLFNMTLDPFQRHSFWLLFFSHLQQWLSTYGCTQTQVQRYCSMKNETDPNKAMSITIPALAVLGVFLILLGLILFGLYSQCDPYLAGKISKTDEIFPYFVFTELASIPGIRGLFIASLFSGSLSTLSSGLNSLAAVCWEDFLKDLNCFSILAEKHCTWITKGLACSFGVLVIGLACLANKLGGLIQATGTINGMVNGPLGGVFWLALLFPFVNGKGALIGIIFGHAVTIWISVGGAIHKSSPQILETKLLNCSFDIDYSSTVPTIQSEDIPVEVAGFNSLYHLSYLLYPIIGCLVTVVVGVVVSLFTGCMTFDIEDKDLMFPFAWNLYKKYAANISPNKITSDYPLHDLKTYMKKGESTDTLATEI